MTKARMQAEIDSLNIKLKEQIAINNALRSKLSISTVPKQRYCVRRMDDGQFGLFDSYTLACAYKNFADAHTRVRELLQAH